MKMIRMAWSTADHIGYRNERELTLTLPPVIYGIAIHPRSQVHGVELLGGSPMPLVMGAPVVWERGQRGDELVRVRTLLPVMGRLVLVVAETPSEAAQLPRYVPHTNQVATVGNFFGDQDDALRAFCDRPAEACRMYVYIPLVPTFAVLPLPSPPVALTIDFWALREQPQDVNTTAPAVGSPGIVAQSLGTETLVSAYSGQAFTWRGSIPPGVVAVGASIRPTTLDPLQEAQSQQSLELHVGCSPSFPMTGLVET